MKQTFTFFSLVTLLLVMSSCEQYRCIRGDDNFIVETRRLDTAIDRIFLESSYDIFITQDSVLNMTVEADQNLMPYIVTDIVDNDLFLETANDRCLSSRNPIRVNLSTPSISEMRIEGSGDVNLSKLTVTEDVELIINGSGQIRCTGLLYANDLYVDIIGSGDVILDKVDVIDLDIYVDGSGGFEVIQESNGDRGDFRIDGSGDIIADKIRLDELEIDINGSGDITCWVERLIYGEIDGSGDLVYRNYPIDGIRVDENGSGRIIPY